MGSAPSRAGRYMTLNPEQQALIKQAWLDIENNPQDHGSVFFMGFCETHPQYTKYFTRDSQVPLTFDARTNAKFTVIMETMGYLLLDFHKKHKQLDHIIGYIAMIHKDMSLVRSDMSNFCNSLLNYLTSNFPSAMTPKCLEITTLYMNNLMAELSLKIEEFRNDESMSNFEDYAKPCSSCLLCNDHLIYGQTVDYWKERKRRWQELLAEWRVKESSTIHLPVGSSTEDEETSIVKSKTEDEISEFAESTARLLESHGIPRTTTINTRSHSMLKRIEDSRQKFGAARLPDQETKNEMISTDVVVPESSSAIYKTPRERRRSRMPESTGRPSSLFDDKTRSSLGMSTEFLDSSELRTRFKGQKGISLARERRRTTLPNLNRVLDSGDLSAS